MIKSLALHVPIPPIYNPAINEAIGKADSPYFSGSQLHATSYVIQLFVINFIRLAFLAGSIVFLFMLLWGAIEYVTAGGEKEKVGNAYKRLTAAFTGLIILFSVFMISRLVKLSFGIDVLQVEIPTILP